MSTIGLLVSKTTTTNSWRVVKSARTLAPFPFRRSLESRRLAEWSPTCRTRKRLFPSALANFSRRRRRRLRRARKERRLRRPRRRRRPKRQPRPTPAPQRQRGRLHPLPALPRQRARLLLLLAALPRARELLQRLVVLLPPRAREPTRLPLFLLRPRPRLLLLPRLLLPLLLLRSQQSLRLLLWRLRLSLLPFLLPSQTRLIVSRDGCGRNGHVTGTGVSPLMIWSHEG